MVDLPAAERAQQIFFSALRQSADAVLAYDDEGIIAFANSRARRLWGGIQAEFIGQPIGRYLPAGLDVMPAAPRQECAFAGRGGKVFHGSVSFMRVMTDRALTVALIRDITAEVREREVTELLSLAVNETDRAVLITNARGQILYVNATFTKMFGFAADEVMGRRTAELLTQGAPNPAVIARMREKLVRGEVFQEESRAIHKDGRELWLSVSVAPVLAEDGDIRYLSVALSNITESRQLQILQRDVLEAIAQDRPLAEVGRLICERVEVLAPEVVCSILTVEDSGLIRPLAAPSLPDSYGRALDGMAAGPVAGSCGTAAHRGEPVVVEDIENDPLWADFKHLPLPLGLRACWSTPVKLRDGRVGGTFAFYFRETRGPSAWHEYIVSTCVHLCAIALERHEAQAAIAKLAYFDTLTGLPNRARLREQIGRSIAAGEKRHAFLFLDIDRFKDVNDTLGHSVGDGLLIEIARRLQRQLRAEDAVSRHGGDEFVAILHDCDARQAGAIAERLLACLAEPILIDGISLPVSASIGISLYPEDGQDEDTLLKHADAAMYEAKSAGRGTYRFYSPQVNALAQERLVLGAALRDSIGRGLLRLHYQPQISAADDSLHGAEALARWSHPVAGDVAPNRFIALAEECGLIETIGNWALDEACRQLREWDERGIGVPTVSVNLSPLHFRNPELFPLVVATLERHGLAPERLTIEITEGIMMDEAPAVLENARALHAHGVRLSMDDFGTGYSSLSYLARLPVRELKIDRGFMRELEADRNAQAVVTAVVRIGQSLGLSVVAEGVEAESQRRFLQALQCHVVQGFLFSRALAPADFEAWLSRYRGTEPAEALGAA